jgi:hypothetical protein
MPWRHTGKWRYSFTLLDISTRWRVVVSFMPLLLYPQENEPCYPLNMWLVGPQSQSGCCGEEKNLVVLGIEPGPWSLWLIAIVTELPWLVLYSYVFMESDYKLTYFLEVCCSGTDCASDLMFVCISEIQEDKYIWSINRITTANEVHVVSRGNT